MKFYTILFTLLSITVLSYGQMPCALDSTFSSDGQIVANYNYTPKKVVTLPNGSVIVACNRGGSNDDVGLIKYNENGTSDQNFGTNAKVILSAGDRATYVEELVLYNDILYIAGSSGTDVGGTHNYGYIAAFDTSGQAVSGFGVNGLMTFDDNVKLHNFGGLVVRNGFIYAGGNQNAKGFVVKIDAQTGAFSSTFNTTGYHFFNTTSNYEFHEVFDLLVQANNKVVVVGRFGSSAQHSAGIFWQSFIMRFNSNGTFDNSFSSNGKAYFNSDTALLEEARNVHVNAVGDYFVTGNSRNFSGSVHDFFVHKVKSNGSLDQNYGVAGWQVLDLNNNNDFDGLYESEMLPDERLLLFGTSNKPQNDTLFFTSLMLHPNGSRDVSFAPNGVFQHIFHTNNNCAGYGLTISKNGKIITTGYTRSCSGGTCGPLYMGLARYTFDIGSPLFVEKPLQDAHFTVYPNPTHDNARIHIKANGKITELNIYDVTGRKVAFTYNSDQRMIQLLNASRGNYFISLLVDNKAVYRKLLLQ